MTPLSRDPVERFSDRVAEYARWRPGYPAALVEHLRAYGFLPASAVVADIGSGTGLSSALFLDAGCTVYAVEPNAPMRAAAERALGARAGFQSIAGRAEATTLDDASVDLVAAGTAFHWFEPAASRAEFARILRPRGRVALFWNRRRHEGAFMQGYEDLMRAHCAGYAAASPARRADEDRVIAFFGGDLLERDTFPNTQELDFDGLLGRVLSSSYAPKAGEAAHAPLRAALRKLFDTHALQGHVSMNYDTRLYVGRVS